MNMELVKINNGTPVTTSKIVSDYFDKEHKHVMDKIRSISCEISDVGGSYFRLSSYVSLQNKTLECYDLTRDGFMLLVMELSGKKALSKKIAFISAFNAMESELLQSKSKEVSVIDELNAAYLLMKSDKEKASVFGSGLNEWRKIRKEHMDRVDKLQGDVQLLLKFK